jgi:hypothetical protein
MPKLPAILLGIMFMVVYLSVSTWCQQSFTLLEVSAGALLKDTDISLFARQVKSSNYSPHSKEPNPHTNKGMHGSSVYSGQEGPSQF